MDHRNTTFEHSESNHRQCNHISAAFAQLSLATTIPHRLPHIMNMDFDPLFPLTYDPQQEAQCLVYFVTDWVKTQQIYNTAFVNRGFSLSTNAMVNPAELDYPMATIAGEDYQTLMSDIQTMNVGQILAHLMNTEHIE